LDYTLKNEIDKIQIPDDIFKSFDVVLKVIKQLNDTIQSLDQSKVIEWESFIRGLKDIEHDFLIVNDFRTKITNTTPRRRNNLHEDSNISKSQKHESITDETNKTPPSRLYNSSKVNNVEKQEEIIDKNETINNDISTMQKDLISKLNYFFTKLNDNEISQFEYFNYLKIINKINKVLGSVTINEGNSFPNVFKKHGKIETTETEKPKQLLSQHRNT